MCTGWGTSTFIYRIRGGHTLDTQEYATEYTATDYASPQVPASKHPIHTLKCHRRHGKLRVWCCCFFCHGATLPEGSV